MQVKQSMSEEVLPRQASGPASAYCPLPAERLGGIDQKLRQTAQLVSLIVGQLEACEFDPATPARRVLEQLDATLEKLLSRFGLDQPAPTTDYDRHAAVDFPIQALFKALAQDFLPLAAAQHHNLRIVPCSSWVRSLPDCLRQLLSGLLANIMDSTSTPRLTLGCRRHAEWLSIELWFAGCKSRDDALRIVSMPVYEASLPGACGKPALRSIAELSAMLGLQLQVKTADERATLISISAPLSPSVVQPGARRQQNARALGMARTCLLLIVEPDALLGDMLSCGLGALGYRTAAVRDSVAALEWIARSGIQPDLILTEHVLERSSDGVQLVQKIRDQFSRATPAVILTAETKKQVSQSALTADCMLLRKPVSLNLLRVTLASALSTHTEVHAVHAMPSSRQPVIYVVDDDAALRSDLRTLLESEGYLVRDYGTAEQFLDSYAADQPGCLIIDARRSGISGLETVARLKAQGDELPVLMISCNSRVADVVDAMKAGVCDFIEKPFRYQQLLTSVKKALASQVATESSQVLRKAAIDHINHLTARQRQILAMVLDGHPSKNIAANLGISQRTVEKHRASIMSRTEARSIPELARIALAAGEKTLSAAANDKRNGLIGG
ncbi:response regulator [Pseudomonas veronii]|uniref:response regulator n=1 Tax=Pseudomonas veronii TaxID=76761 RepID=UPI00265A9FDC|nr:response regulator [Pseudomonas veronii]WKC47377.1 response regulator [Pseudomonas veronii]